MSRLTTDAVALACILAGGAAGTAVTLAALDRTPEMADARCAVEDGVAPKITVAVVGDGGPATAVVSTGHACASFERVLIHESRARVEAEATRARLEATRRQMEHTSTLLELQSRMEREIASEIARAERELDAAGMLESLLRQRREKR